MSPAFLYARGARQGSVEGPDMSNQVLDNALREPAGRLETEGAGFMLATNYRKAQKRRCGSSGDAVKEEGQVLHHLCWADDLYAMAGAMNHLTRILEDMTNAIERLGMKWKEKSLAIVAQIFVCVVTRSTTAEFQHNDMMMRTNVENDLRHEMALEMWIVSVHEKSEQLCPTKRQLKTKRACASICTLDKHITQSTRNWINWPVSHKLIQETL